MPPNLLGLGGDFVYTKREIFVHQLQEGSLKVYANVISSQVIEMAVYGPYNPEIVLQFGHTEDGQGPMIRLINVRLPPSHTGTVPLIQQRDPLEVPEDLVYGPTGGYYQHVFTKGNLRIVVKWMSATVVDISVWGTVGNPLWNVPNLKLQFERIMNLGEQSIRLIELSCPRQRQLC